MLFVEYAPTVKARRGNMLPLDEIEGKTGFRGVYCFSEEIARIIRKSERSVGFDSFPVFSNELMLDFDHGIDEAKKAIKFAKDRDLSYSLFFSGAKGYHIEIPTVAKFGRNVPYSQKVLASRLRLECDLSLYRHASLYRLPGTVHDKTGKKKELLETYMGEAILDYNLQDMPQATFNFEGVEDSDSFEIVLNRITLLYKNPPDPRLSRTQKLFGIAAEIRKAGMCDVTATNLLLALNESWGDRGKDVQTVQRVIKEAFR